MLFIIDPKNTEYFCHNTYDSGSIVHGFKNRLTVYGIKNDLELLTPENQRYSIDQ